MRRRPSADDDDEEAVARLNDGESSGFLVKGPPPTALEFLIANAKPILLISVVTQNAGYSLLRRYAGAIQHSQASTTSILAGQELIKLIISAYFVWSDPTTRKGIQEHGDSVARFVFQHSAKMVVPAAMYLVMNVLGFVALAHISAGLFAVLQQCKLIFTALLSRAMLDRRLSFAKWRSLLLLLCGVVLITLETSQLNERQGCEPQRETEVSQAAVVTRARSYMIGVSAVLVEACLSGFANVYFEGVVKSTPLSIWHRNVQLAVWSLCVFVPRAIYDGNGEPLAGWDGLAVGNTLIGALGGILVALCIAHFDSIAKAVAVTLSVVLTVLGGYALLNGPMSMQLALASAVVITSTINYSFG